MEQIKAKFLQQRPTVQVEIRGTPEQMLDWVEAFYQAFPDHQPRVSNFNALKGVTVLERNRNASTPVS